MFDYKNWVHRAISFTEGLKNFKPLFDEIDIVSSFQPPLNESEIIEIKSNSKKDIPLELIKFWTTGSANLSCHYYLANPTPERLSQIQELFGIQNSLYGGASFMIANKLPDKLLELKEWAEETWIVDYPNEQKFWLNSVPFFEMRNGDYLALDVTVKKDNPPVIYLSHDDESSVISNSFTDFLTNWERLCYIGPEGWLLDIFQDEKGFICSDTEKEDKLRNIFLFQD